MLVAAVTAFAYSDQALPGSTANSPTNEPSSEPEPSEPARESASGPTNESMSGPAGGPESGPPYRRRPSPSVSHRCPIGQAGSGRRELFSLANNPLGWTAWLAGVHEALWLPVHEP